MLKPVPRCELGSALAVTPAATADDFPAPEDDADELDGGHAWVVVFCVWLVLFVFLGQVYSFAVLYATFLDVFRASKGTTALVGGLTTGVMNVLGFLNAPLLARLGYRGALLAGGTTLVTALLATSYATSVAQLILAYGVLGGLGNYLLFLPSFPLLNFWWDKRRAFAVGVAVSGSGFGTMAFGPGMQAMIDAWGWRVALRVTALITAAVVAGAATQYRLPRQELARRQEQQRQAAAQAGAATVLVKVDTLLFKDPVFRVCIGSFLSISFGYFVPFSHTVKLAQHHAYGSGRAASLLTVIGVANTVGRVAAGKIGDVCGRDRTFSASMVIGGVALSLFTVGASASFASLAVLAGLYAFFGGAFVSMFVVLLADNFGLNRAAGAMGMSQCVFSVGTFLGAPVAGWLFDGTGNYTTAFVLAGGFLVLGGAIMTMAPRFRSHPEHVRQLKLFQ
jgi:MFS family permease